MLLPMLDRPVMILLGSLGAWLFLLELLIFRLQDSRLAPILLPYELEPSAAISPLLIFDFLDGAAAFIAYPWSLLLSTAQLSIFYS